MTSAGNKAGERNRGARPWSAQHSALPAAGTQQSGHGLLPAQGGGPHRSPGLPHVRIRRCALWPGLFDPRCS